MEKVVIELPQVVETHNTPQVRTAALEFVSNGKILTKKEADEIVQQWIEYIKKLVPQAKFNLEEMGYAEWVTYEKPTINDMLRELEEKTNRIEKSKPEKEGYYYINVFGVGWEINDPDGETIIIAELDFHISEGKANANVWESDQFGNCDSDKGAEYYDSWEKGVEMFLKTGQEWFEKYGAEINLSVPSKQE